MQVKMEKIYNSLDVFRKLMAQDLPLPMSMKFTKLFEGLNTHFNVLESKRLELVKKFGEKQDTGETVVTDEKRSEFLEKFQDVLDEEIEINWTLTSVEMMGTKATLSVPELNKISFLFSDFVAEEVEQTSEETVSS
tara:strand:- start:100 stop:507 length:408 start_codon:yes stop_codon:yes gene_type:complete